MNRKLKQFNLPCFISQDNLVFDINEIQVNFDLEESEMRIFSEDETIMSTGSGSLTSNTSPRILPSEKLGKLMASIRLVNMNKHTFSLIKFLLFRNVLPTGKQCETFVISKTRERRRWIR